MRHRFAIAAAFALAALLTAGARAAEPRSVALIDLCGFWIDSAGIGLEFHRNGTYLRYENGIPGPTGVFLIQDGNLRLYPPNAPSPGYEDYGLRLHSTMMTLTRSTQTVDWTLNSDCLEEWEMRKAGKDGRPKSKPKRRTVEDVLRGTWVGDDRSSVEFTDDSFVFKRGKEKDTGTFHVSSNILEFRGEKEYLSYIYSVDGNVLSLKDLSGPPALYRKTFSRARALRRAREALKPRGPKAVKRAWNRETCEQLLPALREKLGNPLVECGADPTRLFRHIPRPHDPIHETSPEKVASLDAFSVVRIVRPRPAEADLYDVTIFAVLSDADKRMISTEGEFKAFVRYGDGPETALSEAKLVLPGDFQLMNAPGGKLRLATEVGGMRVRQQPLIEGRVRVRAEFNKSVSGETSPGL
jgi:hypothetical protein